MISVCKQRAFSLSMELFLESGARTIVSGCNAFSVIDQVLGSVTSSGALAGYRGTSVCSTVAWFARVEKIIDQARVRWQELSKYVRLSFELDSSPLITG